MRYDDVASGATGKLNFSHKLLERKHALDVVRPYCGPSVGVEFGTSDEVLDVASLYGHLRSHIVKALINEASALQEITDFSTHQKDICEALLIILASARNYGVSFSQHALLAKDTVMLNKKKL